MTRHSNATLNFCKMSRGMHRVPLSLRERARVRGTRRRFCGSVLPPTELPLTLALSRKERGPKLSPRPLAEGPGVRAAFSDSPALTLTLSRRERGPKAASPPAARI